MYSVLDDYLSQLPAEAQRIARLECAITAHADIGASGHIDATLKVDEQWAELRELLGRTDPQELIAFNALVQHFLSRSEAEGLPLQELSCVDRIRDNERSIDDFAERTVGLRELGPVIAKINEGKIPDPNHISYVEELSYPPPAATVAIRAHLRAGLLSVRPDGTLKGELPYRVWNRKPDHTFRGVVVGKSREEQWGDHLVGMSAGDSKRLRMVRDLIESDMLGAIAYVVGETMRPDQFELIQALAASFEGNAVEGTSTTVGIERSWEELSFRIYGTEAFAKLLEHFNRIHNDTTGEWVEAPLEPGWLIRVPAPIIAADSVLRPEVDLGARPLELAGEFRLPPEVRQFIHSMPDWRQQAALQLVGRMIAFPRLAQPKDREVLVEFLGKKAADRIMGLVEEANQARSGGASPRATEVTFFSILNGTTFWGRATSHLGGGKFGSELLGLRNPGLDPHKLPEGGQALSPDLLSAALTQALIALGVVHEDPVTGDLTGPSWLPSGVTTKVVE